MASVYDLKPKFQSLLRPVVRKLAAAGVTANQVTSAACLLSLLTGAVLFVFPLPTLFLILPAVLFVRMGLNAFDGMLAREHNQKSDVGAILNELGDVVSDVALYLPFLSLAGASPALLLVLLSLAVLTEFVGILGATLPAGRQYQGPMGKSDRALLFGLLGLALGFGIEPGRWLNIVFALASVLLILTILRRTKGALSASV